MASPDFDAGLHAMMRNRVEATLCTAARHQQFVTTLLDVSRIRAGRLDLLREPVDLSLALTASAVA